MKKNVNIVALLCIVAGLFLMLHGCKTQTKIVEVEKIRDRVTRDTILQHDSVYVEHIERIKGDTVYITTTKYKVKTEYKTDYICQIDSIPYEVQVVKEVRVRNAYDKATSAGFWLLLVLFVLLIIYKIKR